MLVECSAMTCSCSDDCTNKVIQNQKSVPVRQFMTERKGWGIKANTFIDKGTFVMEYVGEVVTEKSYKSRLITKYKDSVNSYAMRLCQNFVIDAHLKDNCSRYINHSCEANCELQQWIVNNYPSIAIVAIRDIAPDEEITYDYNFQAFDVPEVCLCGSKNCRKIIGKKPKVCFFEYF